MDPQSTSQPAQPGPIPNQPPDQTYPPQIAPPAEPETPDPPLNFGPAVPPPGQTADINQLVREVQLADGIDVGRSWYSTLRIDPKSDTQTMFDTFTAQYEQDFPYLELPDETTKRFPKQAAVELGAHLIRQGEPAMSYEDGLKRGYQPVAPPIAGLPSSPDLPNPNPPVG